MSKLYFSFLYDFLLSYFIHLYFNVSSGDFPKKKKLKKKSEKDLPACWGLCCFGEFISGGSSLNDTDFSKDTDLSKKSYTTNR